MEIDHLTIAVPTYLLPFVLVAIIISLWVWLPTIASNPSLKCRSTLAYEDRTYSEYSTTSVVPFLILDDPDWTLITRAVTQYERELSSCLAGLSHSLEVCMQSEIALGLSNTFLSKALQTKIKRSATLQDQNLHHLRRLVEEFPMQKMLTQRSYTYEGDKDDGDDGDDHGATAPHTLHIPSQSTYFPPLRKQAPPSMDSSYDSIHQVVAHLVRDWTREGAFVRTSVYDWCRQRVSGPARSILVPGAGLGRLGWDLSQDGHRVEANESSLIMAAVAFHLFQRPRSFVIHPFVNDFFINEVNSKMRFQSVRIYPPADRSTGHLSYTIGDFVRLYGSRHPPKYDVVITCFFLDTATNVLEYLAVLSNVLRMGGQWINIGPLQWHGNAHLQPAADELKALIPIFGFQIHHWSIDDSPVDYRMEDPSRYTKYEGYKPLRMVATKVMDQKKAFPIDLPVPISKLATPASGVTSSAVPTPPPVSTVTIEEL